MATSAGRARRGGWTAAALGLACLGIGACGPGKPPDDGREIAVAFLEEVRTGRIDSAWEGTTAEFKSFMGLDRFRSLVEANAALGGPAEFSGARMTTINGLTMAEAGFRSPLGSTITVLVAPEGGEWRVERLSVE